MSATIFGLSNVVNAYKQKLFKLGTHLTAKSHFTETAVISTNPSTPPDITNLSGLGRRMRAAKTTTPSFPGKNHILPTSQSLSLGKICISLHYFLSLQVLHTFFLQK